MTLILPRYIHGMLQTADKKHVFGDLRPIAYSGNFPIEIRRHIYENIKLGLNNSLMQDEENVYGFFPINESDYVAAHYQLMELTEPTSRGNPIFSEFIFITGDQIAAINWNILEIFKLFQPISYREHIDKDLPDVELSLHALQASGDWFPLLNQYQLHYQSILVRYLSDQKKIIVLSSSINGFNRLRFLCALAQTLPERYRKGYSFSTLASDTSSSMRLFFSNKAGRNSQIVDWQTPKVPTDLPGIIYSTWVLDLINAGNPSKLLDRLSKLATPIPAKSTHLKTWGDELDLSIRNLYWYPKRKEFLQVKIPEQLREHANQILEFSCFYDDQLVADWLSLFFTYLMKLKAYDIGAVSLAKHALLLSNHQNRKYLAQQILQLIGTKQPSIIQKLSEFIEQVTLYASRTNQSSITDFCREIIISSLSSPNYQIGLRLWSELRNLEWAQDESFFISAIKNINKLLGIKEFQFITDAIGCPPSKICIDELGALLKRSRLQTPLTIEFIDNYRTLQSGYYLEYVASSLSETNSYGWAVSLIRYARINYHDIHFRFTSFIEKLSRDQVNRLVNTVINKQNGQLIALISFSVLLLNSTKSREPRSADNNVLLSYCEKYCNHIDIKSGVSICSGKWTQFSKETLTSIKKLLETKSKDLEITKNLQEIDAAIQHHQRIEIIENFIRDGIDQYVIKDFIDNQLPEIINSVDTVAWQNFVSGCKAFGVHDTYQKQIAEALLAIDVFGMTVYQLGKWQKKLDQSELLFESELFQFWLIHARSRNINILLLISNWLIKENFYHRIVGKIIGYECALDKKYSIILAQTAINIDRPAARKLAMDIQEFVSRKKILSIAVKIQSKFSDITPDIVFNEFIKNLSKNILAKTKKEK